MDSISGKTWFCIRKFIFHVVLPIILAIFALIDLILGTSYNKMYMSIIFLLYMAIKCLIDFIFATCSINIFIKLLDHDGIDQFNIAISRRIFLPRFSCWKVFGYIDKICWFIAIDCPLLISTEVINKLEIPFIELMTLDDITAINLIMYKIINYEPVIYLVSQLPQNDGETFNITTKTDGVIIDLQKNIFGMNNYNVRAIV